MNVMIIGVTTDDEYKMPLVMLEKYGFHVGDRLEIIKNGSDSVILRRVD